MNHKPKNTYDFILRYIRRMLMKRSFEERQDAYWVRNRLYIELHDDRQFFVWRKIDKPIINIKLNKHNYVRVMREVKSIIDKELRVFLKVDG